MDELAEIRVIAAAPASREERAAWLAGFIRRAGGYRWVAVYDVEAADVVTIAWSGAGPPAYPRFARERGLAGAAIAARRTVVANDVASDPRYLEALGDTAAEVVVPVLVDGRVRGTIHVDSATGGAFGDRDVRRLELCAASAP